MNKNILLLTVDALRYDRLSLSGYKHNTSPVIKELSKNSIWCSNAFSLAPSTQPSVPCMLTSTRPLSYGGYDFGVKNRPNFLPDLLQKNGYFTKHLITFPWLRNTYGYGVGVDSTEHYYSITGIVGATVHTIRSTVLAYEMEDVNAEKMLKKVTPIILQCFDDLEDFSSKKLKNFSKNETIFVNSFFAKQEYNYESVIKTVKKHRSEFKNNPLSYIQNYIVGLPKQASGHWISKEIKFKRSFKKNATLAANKFLSYLFKKKAGIYNTKDKIYADSSELADQLILEIRKYSKSKRKNPFYLWTHFLDTHAPYCPGELPNWPKNAKKYLFDTGHSEDLDLSLGCLPVPESEKAREVMNAKYDSCIRYTDKQIGRIVNALDEEGILDDTLVVIAGDHGEELGEHGEYGHRFRFYDECINVPIIFYNPLFKEKKITGLSDLSDIAPTILDLLNIQIPETYIGQSLYSAREDKTHIQMETFHRGNCLFEKKPIYMSVRTNLFKYIWKEWIDIEDFSNTPREQLFDLISDQDEKENIAESNPNIVSEMNEIIAKRLSEIEDYVNNRSSEDLIKNGVDKYLNN